MQRYGVRAPNDGIGRIGSILLRKLPMMQFRASLVIFSLLMERSLLRIKSSTKKRQKGTSVVKLHQLLYQIQPQKNPPLRLGEDIGGVIECDFLMSESPIPKLSQSQGPHQKVEAAGVERQRRSRNTFEN